MPQGTVLEPLLFLSYINDLPDVVRSSHTKLFADDCLLFKSITTDRDQQALQSDLSSLQQWEKDWQMEFNPWKCTAIRVMPKKTKLVRETSYAIHNKMLETSNTSRCPWFPATKHQWLLKQSQGHFLHHHATAHLLLGTIALCRDPSIRHLDG